MMEGDDGHRQTNQEDNGGPAGQPGDCPGALSAWQKASILAVANQITLSQASYGAGALNIPTPIKDDGIVAGEIVAYRAWQYSPHSNKLFSISAGRKWEPNTVMEGDPDRNLWEGVYAFKNLLDAVQNFHTTHYFPSASTYVIGSVSLWGRVIEHETGYRAQYARIRSLDWAPDPTVLSNLQKTYGVPSLLETIKPDKGPRSWNWPAILAFGGSSAASLSIMFWGLYNLIFS